MNSFKLFYALFFDQPTSRRFIVGVWVGLAFSISIILSTIGVMDGFEKALRTGLRLSNGDITMQSQTGFFEIDDYLSDTLKSKNIINYSNTIQTESFLITEEEARGVVVRGIDSSYGNVVGMDLDLGEDEVIIGTQLAQLYQISENEEVVLAFGKGSNEFKNMPSLHRFTVKKIVEHGVYQRDLRSVYIDIKNLQNILNVGNKINLMVLNAPKIDISIDEHEYIENVIGSLRGELGYDYIFRPYWREFTSLIEAARAEKFMISVILQLIVIISIFNILAFIYFINEKKSKELFLFKALGLSKKAVGRIWIKLVFGLWLSSCALSVVFVAVIKQMILRLPFLQLPPEVYQLPRLELSIAPLDYLIVFMMALFWILLITYYLIRKLRKTSLLEGLRQEFA